MKAIILAAGTGSRLLPLTSDRPKCLIELGGRALLDWQIQSLRTADIRRITAVTGYFGEKVEAWVGRGLDECYRNPRFAETNMVSSLLTAAPELHGDLVVSYGDIIYSPDVPRALAASTADISVVVDRQWLKLWSLRFPDPLADAETLVVDDHGNIREIGRKSPTIARIMGQYIGLLRFTDKGLDALKACCARAAAASRSGKGIWRGVASLERAYMTDLLQGLIDEGTRVSAVYTDGNWFEVDSCEDHALYQRLIQERPDRSGPIFNIGRD